MERTPGISGMQPDGAPCSAGTIAKSGRPTQTQRNTETACDYLWLISLIVASAILRLYQLGDTPFHHDESIHAYFSYQLWQGHPYRFDPVYHGPFLYWTNAFVYLLFGDSDFTARLLPATFSIALLLPLWLLRTQLGAIGWKVAGAFLVVSPTFTYYGRFLAHDNYAAMFTLLLLCAGIAAHRARSAWGMVALGLVLGLFLATKAVAYITIGLFAIFVLLVFALDTYAPRLPRAALWRLSMQWLYHRRVHIALGLLALLVTYTALYSSFFTYWPGVRDGLVGTLGYWTGQHLEPRIPGPVYFYLPRFILHEPVFLLAIPAVVWAARTRLQPLDTLLAFWTVANLAVYAYAQEKVPWLMMHMLLPMLLLVGRWVDSSWRPGRARLALCAVLAVTLSWSLRETLWLNFTMPPAAPHLLTYMATTAELKRAAEQIQDMAPASGEVFLSGPATWPLAWYLRDLDVTYSLPNGWEATALVVVAEETDREKIEPAGFRSTQYPLMTWWYPDLWQLFSEGLPAYLGHSSIPEARDRYYFSLFQRIDSDPQSRNQHE